MPQQSCSTSDNIDEDTERQDAFSSQMEDNLISGDYIIDEEKGEDSVEAMVSPVRQHVKFSDDQGEGNAEGNATLVVTDITGKVVLSEAIVLNNGKSNVDLSTIESGIYVFNILTESGKKSQFNVVKD